MNIILASNSPRRKELLTQLGLQFDVIAPDVEEIDYSPKGAADVALTNAVRKARAAQAAVQRPDALIIAADTIVVKNGKIYGKPTDAAAALVTLAKLSGRTHQVITAIAVAMGDRFESTYCTTAVRFADINAQEMEAYIATGEPLDKAGAYGIQGHGALLVKSIDGCYFNVMGLPLYELKQLLSRMGIKIF